MLKSLITVARECGEIAIDVRKQGLRARNKGTQFGAHFSTQADDQSEAHARKRLRQLFGRREALIGEESTKSSRLVVPDDCIVFDPVDGTTNHLNNCDEFAVGIATLRNGKPHSVVMHYPLDKMTISAERGRGWFINGKRQPKITWKRPTSKAHVGIDIGPWLIRDKAWLLLNVVQPLARRGTQRSLMSGMWGFRDLLLGHTWTYLNLNIAKIWDVAPGALILEEAGGFISDPWGKPLTWNRINMDWVAAANRKLANRVLRHTKHWKGR